MPTPIKLKPCPFCGGKATMREYSNGHKGNGEFTASYKVGCEKCQIYFFSGRADLSWKTVIPSLS